VSRVRRVAAVAAVAGALALPAGAAAHVTVQPMTAPAGGYTRLDLRVPNERDDAVTTKVVLRLPPGFAEASYEPVPGWAVTVRKTKLATPIRTDDGVVAEQVSTMTWTGHGALGRIPPGAFQDFGLSVQVPGKPGGTLTFKALQVYSDGQVVRWIGPEGSENPAPQVGLVAANAAPASSPSAATATPAATPARAGASDQTLAVVALIVGALGLAAGAAGILVARPPARRTRLRPSRASEIR